jgi:2-dehydropantoate 2-reductase
MFVVRPTICIYGAGAIGCHIAGHLARTAKASVTVVDREHNVSAIQKNGIRVITPTDDFTVQVNATTDPAEAGIQDYVIITLKIQQAIDSLTAISKLIGPETTIVPPSTGIPFYYFHKSPGKYDDARLVEVDPDGRQWKTMPPDQVLPMVF